MIKIRETGNCDSPRRIGHLARIARRSEMAERLDLNELRPELRAPEIRPFLLAYLA